MSPPSKHPEQAVLAPQGGFPNSPLPALIYRGVAADAAAFEDLFAANGWTGSWRNGVYDFHHFHSTAHEVLGIASGSIRLRLGGEAGQSFSLSKGDVVVIPAGVAHCREAAEDLLVVGAYADGRDWDIQRGDPAELEAVLANISEVPLPRTDPVEGAGGPLLKAWS
jgi:uncharacterized protein YjlB